MQQKTSPPETLASALQSLREQQGLSQAALAAKAEVPLTLIEDIEAALELFLSVTTRQKLARALKIRPSFLKSRELPRPDMPTRELSLQGRDFLTEEILHFPHESHTCPMCQAPLDVRIFQRRDLEDNPLLEVKATCSQCLFKL